MCPPGGFKMSALLYVTHTEVLPHHSLKIDNFSLSRRFFLPPAPSTGLNVKENFYTNISYSQEQMHYFSNERTVINAMLDGAGT